MKKLLLTLAVAILAVPGAVFAQKNATPSGPTSIPGGLQSATYVISKPGAYVLAASRTMSDTTKPAIEIAVPDVTLDLNGFTLGFTGTTGSGAGISAPSAVNVEIRNGSICNTPGPAVDSSLAGGDSLRLVDLRISDTGGVKIVGSNTLVDRCHVVDTHGDAISASGIGAAVRNCQVRSSMRGIHVGAGAQVTGNVVNNTSYSGISVWFTDNAAKHGATVQDNTVCDANSGGEIVHGGIAAYTPGVIIKNNTIVRARTAGILVTGGGCVFEGNSIVGSVKDHQGGGGVGIHSYNSYSLARNNLGINNSGSFLGGFITNLGGNSTN